MHSESKIQNNPINQSESIDFDENTLSETEGSEIDMCYFMYSESQIQNQLINALKITKTEPKIMIWIQIQIMIIQIIQMMKIPKVSTFCPMCLTRMMNSALKFI